ncbi:CBS domain-containing protein [Halorarius litoreus]|uniref:CBS domain-containing protein n=1 Tax=Halorarius litoreus TaxID=2962676 RepID=UPI0020CF29F7|nr:CBS domain-containing protein [Halorarius litoreus]
MRSFRIGSLFGIPIKLDLTFLIVLPLFAFLIGSSLGTYVELLNDQIGAGLDAGALTGDANVAFTLGALAAIGLFVGVVLHELGHSLVAMRFGFPIASITLWLFGGVAQLTEMPEDWKQELYIAIAGPIVSILLGVASYGAFLLVEPNGSTLTAGLRFVLGYLAVMNVVLAAFNMLPGFPMDGGRVLRALLARTRPYARATQLAAEVGKGFAILLGLFGLFGGGGLFLVAIAFFIYIGASSEAQQTMMKAAFEGVTVRDIMTPGPEVRTVTPETSVADLIGRMFRERHTGYPVVENGQIVGVVTLTDAQTVNEVERDAYRVEEVMSRELQTIGPDADAIDALEQMQSAGVGRLLVMEGDDLIGLVSRTDLMTALNIIRESGSLEGQTRDPESLASADRPA